MNETFESQLRDSGTLDIYYPFLKIANTVALSKYCCSLVRKCLT